MTSQCSTRLPLATLKMSMMASPRAPGAGTAWTCSTTRSPNARYTSAKVRAFVDFFRDSLKGVKE